MARAAIAIPGRHCPQPRNFTVFFQEAQCTSALYQNSTYMTEVWQLTRKGLRKSVRLTSGLIYAMGSDFEPVLYHIITGLQGF